MNEAFICDAVRTPIGRYGGSLATMRTDDLASLPIRALGWNGMARLRAGLCRQQALLGRGRLQRPRHPRPGRRLDGLFVDERQSRDGRAAHERRGWEEALRALPRRHVRSRSNLVLRAHHARLHLRQPSSADAARWSRWGGPTPRRPTPIGGGAVHPTRQRRKMIVVLDIPSVISELM